MRPRVAISLTGVLFAAVALAACGNSSDGGHAMTASPPSQPSSGTTPSDNGNRDPGVLHFTMNRIDGTRDDLSDYAGKVVLVVNTATECGFTPQFEGLDRLYEQKRGEGFVVLGFPADDVAGQEPRSDEEIAEFCEANYGVSFPMFAKITAEGDDAHPLFQALGEPDWNFNKYLLDRGGELVQRWGATTEPDDPELVAAIDEQLGSPKS